MRIPPRWVPETVTKQIETGHLICEACGSIKGMPHLLFCYHAGEKANRRWTWDRKRELRNGPRLKSEQRKTKEEQRKKEWRDKITKEIVQESRSPRS